MNRVKQTIIVLLCAFLCQPSLYAQAVTPSQLFTNGFVLQQNSQAPIWGTAAAGTQVTVKGSWDNKEVSTVTASNGRWEVLLETPAGGNTAYTVTINGKVIQNVLIGEVWICSGQSNMKFRLGESWNDNWQVQNDNIQTVRFFEVEVTRSTTPLNNVKGSWKYGAYANNMQHISAIGYYFARKMNEVLKVPVGMIGMYEGGTAAEEWTRKELFDKTAALRGTYTASQPVGCLYNGMVAPVLPYKNSGIIWYQGENNVGHQASYKTLLKVMVEGWRQDFKDPTLPFYIGQLTSYDNDDWRTFRELQKELSDEIPNSGLAVTLDGGDATEIHPRQKKLIGDRLALIALGRVYGQDVPVSSPVFCKEVLEADKIRVYFDYVKDGFQLTGTDTEAQHFEICGADKVYYPASALIEGNTVLLWNEKVSVPVASRYFWRKYAIPNIYTKEGLPIVPYRSVK